MQTPQQAFAQAALLEPQAAPTPKQKVWRVDARSFGGHVNVEDEWEAHIWCRRFACTLQQLRDAVKIKGTSANALRRYFEMKEYGDI
jgi:hypothetical protein